MTDSFGARSTLVVGADEFEIFRLDAVGEGHVDRLPYSLKILLENLLRHEDGRDVTRDDILALANWDAKAVPSTEISFTPSRVILQDFTGVPAVVDLAAMREAVVKLGGSASSINPLSPAELVIDHSVQVDNYGAANALDLNNKIEFQRNKERYSFLRWGQSALDNFRVVPPNTGIVHQVNLEYLSRVVFDTEQNGRRAAYPDTVVGTDSHTTMINGLGVLGWGVGGIEAEAAMLGQPITMLIPNVVGFKLVGELKEGTTATDLVLTVTQMLREKGVVGQFVEFFGDGLGQLPLADRTGSSRDWAAKGTILLGVKAVIAKSFERIHRSNLIGMGVLPLQFMDGQDAASLGLTGKELFDIRGQTDADAKIITVSATSDSGDVTDFKAQVRIDTPKERDYYENGGILHYVLRQLAA